MIDIQIFHIIEAAYDLSEGRQKAIRNIAKAATGAIPRGPVTVMHFDSDAQLDPDSVCFERADQEYVSRFLEWQRVTPAVHQFALSLTPRAIHFRTEACEPLPDELKTMARQLFPLCVMANTGDGGGLHVAFGDPDLREWRPAQVRHFHGIALHLAAAWRLRRVLEVDAILPAIAPELGVGSPSTLTPNAHTPTAREALRHAVLAWEQARTHRRSASDQELWPALLAGRWSLTDAFTVVGTRYIVAYENSAESVTLRALSWREQSVLELALAGRSGKWIAVELQLSESAVTRTLRTSLRKIGATDTSALAGVRTARFKPLDGPSPGVHLAVAQLMPAAPSLSSLSGAERAIVAGILSDNPIAAIARERGTSPRTVAHQIASTYRKLGVSSRRELLALLI
jgi:DNA-binding NarL/FixJ family response regulator